MITIKDIAKLAKVSQSTVSKALNDRPDVSHATRQKILTIVKQYNFSPNAFGKGLKSRTTGNIGALFCREPQPLSGNPFYSRVLEGIEAEVVIQNYNLVLHLVQKNQQNVLPKIVRERQVDGIILIGVLSKQFILKMLDSNIPIVLVDPKITVNHCNQILIDNEHGAFIATQYLINKGHRRIGFISGDLERLSFKQRYEGYIKALKFHKIPIDESLIQTGGVERGYEHVKALLQLDDIPTAIFAANDINAVYGYKAICDMKLKVPDNLSIMGFDDIDMSKISSPPLTTIRVYKEELGSIAVRTLLKTIKHENENPCTTIVPVKLIERESVKAVELR